MRAEPVSCGTVAAALPRILDGTRRTDRAVARHVETCLRCQAELARYRRMLRLLHQLRDQRPDLPPGALRSVLAELETRAGQQAVRSVLGGRRGIVAGLAVAGAVGVVGAGTLLTALVRDRGRPAGGRGGGFGRGAALLIFPNGPSGFGLPGKATAAALGAAEGQ